MATKKAKSALPKGKKAAPAPELAPLTKLRAEIDGVDARIQELLNDRVRQIDVSEVKHRVWIILRRFRQQPAAVAVANVTGLGAD